MSDHSDDDDNEEFKLSESTMALVRECLEARAEREKKLEELKFTMTTSIQNVSDINFEEDWGLSQFWYDEATVDSIVKVVLKLTDDDAKIALISCPTLYPRLKKEGGKREVKLFEFDTRFSCFGDDFMLYDYKSPLNVPKSMANSFDLVIADPPFLSEDCLSKTATTVAYLSQKHILLCTGVIMCNSAESLLNLNKCKFEPHHKNKLGNEFACYANFPFDDLLK